jgi:hypothetical protein
MFRYYTDEKCENLYSLQSMGAGAASYHGHLVVLTAFLFLGACSRPPEELSLSLPATPPVSRSVIGYGVISSSYTHVQSEPDPGSVSLGYLRRGSMVEILERRIISVRGTSEPWIRVNGTYRGWIKEEGVLFYRNEAQARTASESLSRVPELRRVPEVR